MRISPARDPFDDDVQDREHQRDEFEHPDVEWNVVRTEKGARYDFPRNRNPKMSGVVNAFVSVAMGRQERSGCRDGVVGEGERGEGADSGAPALLSGFDHFLDFQPLSIVSFFHFS